MWISRLLLATLAVSAFAAAPDGEALYKTRCSGCHDGQPQPRMPERSQLTSRTPEFVLSVMANGVMTMQAAGLSNANARGLPSYPSASPRKELDFILHSARIEVNRFEIPDVQFSDHLPLICDFTIHEHAKAAA